MLRVKICGITRVEDALWAAEAGADAVGLVFYEKSPRHVDVETAAAIRAALPPFVTAVGLFVNATRGRIAEILAACPLDLLQFHGSEAVEACTGHGRPWIKALRVAQETDLTPLTAAYPGAAGFLLDSAVAGVWGGSGQRFAWWRLPRNGPPLILAGGLGVENVAEAVRIAQPYAVDVSSGVERAPGVKDRALMRMFVSRARAALHGEEE